MPAFALLAGLPMRLAVGTSLVVISVNSLAVFVLAVALWMLANSPCTRELFGGSDLQIALVLLPILESRKPFLRGLIAALISIKFKPWRMLGSGWCR